MNRRRWAAYEAGGKLGYVYFPTSSIISLLYVMEDGSSAEIAVTGNDGQPIDLGRVGGQLIVARPGCKGPDSGGKRGIKQGLTRVLRQTRHRTSLPQQWRC